MKKFMSSLFLIMAFLFRSCEDTGLEPSIVNQPGFEYVDSKDSANDQSAEATTGPGQAPGGSGGGITAPEAGLKGYIWKVPPTFDYEKVLYCEYCDLFTIDYYDTLDTRTGEIIVDSPHSGHGAGFANLMYDADKDVFMTLRVGDGYADIVFESADLFRADLSYRDRLLAVEKADWAIIEKYKDSAEQDLHLILEACSGQFALMYNSEFISDFIYQYDPWCFGVSVNDAVALALDGKMGVVDAGGKTIVPFIFDDIVLIDDVSAFAKLNGKYGIIVKR